ncbi:MAG: long-chain-fatty-acid--CoA ligase [Candidatus Tectomicrobia bacterium]|nr:long-chain-fatty-acid--CoA ligase [Candidatus Tectomicrobia bacterium]
MNVASLIEGSCERNAQRPALHLGEQTLAYDELGRRISRLASSLRRLGVQPGERLALLLPNSVEYLVSYYAAVRIGAVAVPLNPLLRAPEVRYILEDCQAGGLIVDQTFAPTMQALEGELPFLRHEIVVGPPGWAGISFEALLEAGDESCPVVDRDDSDLGTLIYTSGMTGNPKGAMLCHRGLIAAAQAAVASFHVTPPDCIVGVLPYAHIFGTNIIVQAPLVAGASVVVISRFEPAGVLAAMERRRASKFAGVPLMLIALSNVQEAAPRDVRSLRQCMVGGTTVPMEVVRRFESLFPNCEVVEAYGISENTGIVTQNPFGGGQREHSAGVPVGRNEVRIVDDAGDEAPRGQAGEVAVRGPQLLLGYWGKREATAAALRDGWLLTGDVGRLDEEGYLYLIDRKKDLIITAGYNVYPREVENVLYTLDGVQEAAVIGMPDAERGELVKAVIVPKPGAVLSAAAVTAFCAERLAAYKLPRRIEFAEDLPRTASGKILKRALRAATPGASPSERGSQPGFPSPSQDPD